MQTNRARAALIIVAALLFQLLAVSVPANACGCGAMVPRSQGQISVDDETSVLRWDGRTEQIVMRLAVHGSAHDAAWIMPVPHRATVKLGDVDLFTDLSVATAPEVRTRHYFWPRAGDWPFDGGAGDGAAATPSAAGSGVGVVGRERLGPFDVARLTATDPDALADWLHDNGFELPARLDRALRPYVDQGWEYVAVRLAPATADHLPMTGSLDPLHLTFASERPVYPMRLSRLARTEQHLNLYVLAAHRMEPRSAIGGAAPRMTFAGKVTNTYGPLAEFATGTPYLTAYTQDFPTPSTIDGDHELRRSAHDTAYRQVKYEDELLTVGPDIPVWLLTVLGAFAAVATTVILLVVRARRRRPVVPPAPVQAPPPLR
ncbi:DUF2330 domain-containing protein [Streptomyces sp. NPDC059524]|uniref:DUF2330 domain-containing protein n=1 Tax=Streptomyces sp. NPDC059524 TaxID=3346856 RepID=UPI00369EE640